MEKIQLYPTTPYLIPWLLNLFSACLSPLMETYTEILNYHEEAAKVYQYNTLYNRQALWRYTQILEYGLVLFLLMSKSGSLIKEIVTVLMVCDASDDI